MTKNRQGWNTDSCKHLLAQCRRLLGATQIDKPVATHSSPDFDRTTPWKRISLWLRALYKLQSSREENGRKKKCLQQVYKKSRMFRNIGETVSLPLLRQESDRDGLSLWRSVRSFFLPSLTLSLSRTVRSGLAAFSAQFSFYFLFFSF